MRLSKIWKFLIALLALATLPIVAQTPAIDPGLLTKANSGDTTAQVLVGESYAEGKSVTKNLNLAAAWYKKAADQGSVPAQLHLAALYRDGGKGLPRDVPRAASWYAKAAKQNDVTAQAALGVLYSIGQGVPRDDVEAYYWLGLAASVQGPNQQQYAANRQMIGARITTDQQADVDDRVAQWLAAHPHPAPAKQ
jgi:TPR repeat protein